MIKTMIAWLGRPLLASLGLCLLAAAMNARAEFWPGSSMRFDRLLRDGFTDSYDVGSIKTMAQDTYGFIWIGGEYGLARYDGTKSVRYHADPTKQTALASNFINELVVDREGVLWIATDRGLHRYNSGGDNFTRVALRDIEDMAARVATLAVDSSNRLIIGRDTGVSVFDQADDTYTHYPLPYSDFTHSVSVYSVCIDRDDRVWVGTKGAGAALLDLGTGSYHFYRHDAGDASSITDNFITAIAQDAAGRLWFGSHSNGLSRLDNSSGAFTTYRNDSANSASLGSNLIWDIHTDSDGVLWIATDHGGLNAYSETTDSFVQVRHKPFDTSSISSNQVRKIFEDDRGDLWIGVFPAGLDFYNREAAQFTNHTHQPDRPDSLSHSAILNLLETSDGTLWVGTESGLNAYDRARQRFTRFTRGSSEYNLSADAVLSLAEDGDHLWVGTWSGGVNRLDRKTLKFEKFLPQAGNTGSLNSAMAWSIIKDRQGQIWIGTEGGGLNLYQPETGTFAHWLHDPKDPASLDSNYIWTMLQDSRGWIWIGTSTGLNVFDPVNKQFRDINLAPADLETLAGARVRGLEEDRRGRLWIGTQDGGFFIYDPAARSLQRYAEGSDLPALYVTGFVEDESGFMWATTTRGMVMIAPDTMAMRVFNRSHGLVGHNFNREANVIDRNGNIYVGSSEGLSVFKPDSLHDTGAQAPLLITGMRVLNKPVSVGESHSPLVQPVWLTRQITVNHRQSMFSFEFSKLDFRNRTNRRYAYKLEGFDRDWNQVESDPSATFTNLSPGRYTFRVKAGNDNGWGGDETAIAVQVLPPPWRSPPAYFGYTLAGLAILALFINALVKHYQLASQQQTNRELVKLNELKDAFLANTSHELRTPLNGIIGIADTLSEHLRSDPFTASRLSLIASSGRRLANLINDILDFSKLSKQSPDLDLKPLDLSVITDTVFALLAPLNIDKPVHLLNRLGSDGSWVMADENRLQQILINLVGNGIKYTAEGEVSVSIRPMGDSVCVMVQDSGIGISKEQHQVVFEAFHQVQHSTTRQYGGTGLGLAITKQLVELHGGKIWVETPAEGGTRIAFTLRAAERGSQTETPEADSKAKRPAPAAATPPAAHADPAPAVESKPRNAKDQTVLVVDDDMVNRMVLRGYLELHRYQVLEAESGAAAIAVLESIPNIDLVIMDIMMPNMSGFQACETIRKTYPAHLLPILFLTAKSNSEKDMATCFSVGGDDFLTKPIRKDDLLPRVANHLRIRGIIRQLQFDLDRARLHAGEIPQKP